MHTPASPISGHMVNLAILILLSGLLFFLGLGSMGLTDRDEGRNAEAGREMLETGNWVSPTFNYEPRFAKPALVYWLMSLSYRWLGIDEFAARFPSAAFGVVLIVLQYLFVSRFCGAAVGLLSALMLLLNIEMIGLSRMALTDGVLICFTTLSLYSFWLGFHGRQNERGWRWICYLAMGMATLAKGPVGFLVPLVTITLYLTVTKQWRRFWHEGTPVAGLLLFALVALPWYLVMWSLHGAQYAASAQANTVGRFLSPMEGHGFTILFYVPVLLLGFFPWSGWLPFAWYQAYRSWREDGGALRISSDAQKSTPVVPDFNLSQYNSKLGMVHGGVGLRRLHVFYVVVHQAGSLYRTTVSSRRAAHRNVLAPEPPRCSDKRSTRLDPYHDDHGLYFGHWICIVAVPVSFVCWRPGEGVPARDDDDSRERAVCRLRGPVGRDGAGRLLWVE